MGVMSLLTRISQICRSLFICIFVWFEVQFACLMYGHGIRQLEKQERDGAEVTFQHVLKMADDIQQFRPNVYVAYELRALALYQMKHSGKDDPVWDNILKNADMAIQLSPNRVSAEGYMVRGMAWYMQDDVQRAVDDFSTAIHRAPNSRRIADAYTERSVIYGVQENYELSLCDAKNGVRLCPSSMRARLVLASAYLAFNQVAEASEQISIIRNTVPSELLRPITNRPPWTNMERKINEINMSSAG